MLYDESMDIIYHPIVLAHDTGAHPENSARITSLGNLPVTELPLSEEPILRVHTREYVDMIKQACLTSTPLDRDTAVSPKSWDAALYAVAATIKASEVGGFAVVRPPGHHAHPMKAQGFCLFNNITIAVKKLVSEGKRVLVFDFDGHVGDGTEEFFYCTNRVLYWSLHQFPAYPMKGSVDEIGDGEGKGYTINIQLPIKSGDDIYRRAIQKVLPIAKKFAPDIVAVSAGFDGHKRDPLLDLDLTVDMYYELGVMLRENFSNIFATLEGGYNTEVFPKCVYNFLDGVNGKPKQCTEEQIDSTILTIESFEITLDRLIKNLSAYWNIS
jgi:acetoin utilization deacetylase AcuC-like enzyme